MKSIVRLLVFSLSVITVAQGAWAESLPQFRPALLGHHKRSLINTIDTESLMKRGQKDATVMFECGVNKSGKAYDSRTFRESPNSELLKRELMTRLDHAQFDPASWKGSRVEVYLTGTVVFVVRDGRPHLRIFLHQEDDDLKKGSDFVAPQFAFIPGTKFEGILYPPSAPGSPGVAAVRLDVDAMGQVQGAKVVYEHPAGMGFGAQAAGGVRKVPFIPGFRNGKPVACQFTWTMVFPGPGRRMRSG